MKWKIATKKDITLFEIVCVSLLNKSMDMQPFPALFSALYVLNKLIEVEHLCFVVWFNLHYVSGLVWVLFFLFFYFSFLSE